MKYELKSIGAWSFIKVSFVMNLVIGFLIGLLYAMILIPLLSLLGSSGGPFGMQSEVDLSEVSFGVLIIILPIAFAFGGAVFNTIFGLILVGVYNLAAKLLGGLELNLNPTQPAGPYAAAAPMQPEVRPTYMTPPPPPPAPERRDDFNRPPDPDASPTA